MKTSWKTDVAVERKKRQIQNAQIGTQAARAAKTPRVLIRCRLAWEAGRIELARSGAANRRTRAGAGAFCVSAVMLVFGQAGLRVARPPAAVSMQPGSSREDKGQDKAAGSARTCVHWSEAALRFAMRELFFSRITAGGVVTGRITEGQALVIEPLMSEGGVIFFDGMEARRLQFAASMSARIQIAASSGPPLARGPVRIPPGGIRNRSKFTALKVALAPISLGHHATDKGAPSGVHGAFRRAGCARRRGCGRRAGG